jgi:hypothetical protein
MLISSAHLTVFTFPSKKHCFATVPQCCWRCRLSQACYRMRLQVQQLKFCSTTHCSFQFPNIFDDAITTAGLTGRRIMNGVMSVALASSVRTLGSWVRILLEAWMSVYIYSVLMLSCVGSGLATGWSPVQGVLPTVCRIKKLKWTKSFVDALCSSGSNRNMIEWMSEWMNVAIWACYKKRDKIIVSIVCFTRHNKTLKGLFTSTVYNEFIDLDSVLLHVSAYGNHHQADIHY